MIDFDDLFKAGKVVKDKIRRGRGESSKGKTSGRGGKGQTARSGHRIIRGFEGGQTPLHMRLPKKGFTSHAKNDVNLVNLDKVVSVLRKISDLPPVLNKEYLMSIGIIKNLDIPVKLVSMGSAISKEIKKNIKFDVEFSSKSASGFLVNTSVSS